MISAVGDSRSEQPGTMEGFSDEERRLLDAQAARIEEHAPYDCHDPTFWIPHQQDIGRMVRFNRLTVTIDDIIAQCGYPESERARLAAQHRRTAEEYLKYYRGPVGGSVPLLDARSAAVD